MRTGAEVRADLAAVADEIQAKREAFWRGRLDPVMSLVSHLEPLIARREELVAELAEIREGERMTPDLFDLGPALATAKAMDSILAQGFPALFGGK